MNSEWVPDAENYPAGNSDVALAAAQIASTYGPNAPEQESISPDETRRFRQRATENGYRLIRVRSDSKAPVAREWPHGDSPEVLLDVRSDSLNTGLVLKGLRCIDCDIDDGKLVLEVVGAMRRNLPAGALIRRRPNSPRLAILYRAAEGTPSKRVMKGPSGKVEILGAGQQVVVHGLHPSGAPLSWHEGRGPDIVSVAELPAVSEEQITAFLDACAPLLGASTLDMEHAAALPPVAPGFLLPTVSAPPLVPVHNDLGAGIESPNWFAELPAQQKRTVVKACLDGIDNRTSDARDSWLRVLFAVAHAERQGCPDARQLVLEWSQRGASWSSEVDFDTAWGSYKYKPGGITIGSLLAMAQNVGVDLSRWRDQALARSHAETATNGVTQVSSAPSQPIAPRSLSAAQLPSIPAKRQWLHGIDLVRGAVSLLVAPGGRGKSSWLVTLALACASDRSLLGARIFGGPLRVLLVSAEDPVAEVALRIRAAMKHHGLTDGDVPGLHVIGADRWGLALLYPGHNGPMLNKTGWDELSAELDRLEPDVLILDPLISVMGGASQNDNAAAALFMGHLVGLAAKRRIGVMVAHHAAKGRDPVSADSAMGAASFVNLSRIALAIEPLAAGDAGTLGLPPWECRDVFRVVGTKHNLSPPAEGDRWFRIVSVHMRNEQPPTYPNGDNVGVVEVFRPGVGGPRFSPALISDALRAIDSSTVPLSPSKRATGRYAVPAIYQAIAAHRGGRTSDVEAAAVLDHLIRTALVRIESVKVSRPGGRSDARNGLVLTPAGKEALQAQRSANSSNQASPQPPQSRKVRYRRGREFLFARRQHVRHRYARCCRPAGVADHITCKRIASEAGRSRVRPSASRERDGPHREGEEP